MKNLFKKVVTLSAACALGMGLVGCGEDSSKPNPDSETGKDGKNYTLVVWGAQEDQDLLKSLCNKYAKQNSNNTYKFLFGVLSESEAADKILKDPEAGPDVFSFPSDQINRLKTGGVLARIGGENLETVKKINSPESVDAATLTIGGEDQLYAYPATGDNCYFVYYDKRVYSDETELGSMESILEKAKANDKKFAFKLNNDGWYLSSFFFAQPELKYEVTYDDALQESAISINYDDPAGLDVMKALRSYIDNDNFVTTTDDSKIVAGFTDSTLSAAVSGPWNQKVLKDILGDNLGIAKLPTAKIGGEDVQLSGYFGYKLMGVNGFTKKEKMKEAHKLALFLTDEQAQIERFNVRGFGPTNKAALERDEIKNDPMLKVIFEQQKFNRTQKGVPSTYWTPMGSLINDIVAAKLAGTELPSDEKLQEILTAACKSIRK